MQFQTETRGRRDVMLVELDGATSSTKFHFAIDAAKERRGAPVLVRPLKELPAVEATLAFDRMADGRMEHELPVDVHTDRIRVTQLDGARAWSSPFFFGAPSGR